MAAMGEHAKPDLPIARCDLTTAAFKKHQHPRADPSELLVVCHALTLSSAGEKKLPSS